MEKPEETDQLPPFSKTKNVSSKSTRRHQWPDFKAIWMSHIQAKIETIIKSRPARLLLSIISISMALLISQYEPAFTITLMDPGLDSQVDQFGPLIQKPMNEPKLKQEAPLGLEDDQRCGENCETYDPDDLYYFLKAKQSRYGCLYESTTDNDPTVSWTDFEGIWNQASSKHSRKQPVEKDKADDAEKAKIPRAQINDVQVLSQLIYSNQNFKASLICNTIADLLAEKLASEQKLEQDAQRLLAESQYLSPPSSGWGKYLSTGLILAAMLIWIVTCTMLSSTLREYKGYMKVSLLSVVGLWVVQEGVGEFFSSEKFRQLPLVVSLIVSVAWVWQISQEGLKRRESR